MRTLKMYCSILGHRMWRVRQNCRPKYLLTKLENKFQDIAGYGGFEYFDKKFCDPMLQGLHYFSAVEGFITSCQWLIWLLSMVKRTLVACCKPPMHIQTEGKLRPEVLLELMGDSTADRCEPYCQTSAAHRRGLPSVGVWFTS